MDSQNDPQRQITDIRVLLSQGIDALIVSPAHAATLERALEGVMRTAVPIVAVNRQPGNSDLVITQVAMSDAALGRTTARWLAERLGGGGTILALLGKEGVSSTENRMAAAQEVFCQHSRMSLIDVRYTNWDRTLARELTAELLRAKTIPDAVWCDSGQQCAGSMEAFLDAGVPSKRIPPHTGGDMNGALQLAVRHGVPFAAVESPVHAMATYAMQAVLDILAGKQVGRYMEVRSRTIVSQGDETRSVRADVFAHDYVRWDKGAEFVLSSEC